MREKGRRNTQSYLPPTIHTVHYTCMIMYMQYMHDNYTRVGAVGMYRTMCRISLTCVAISAHMQMSGDIVQCLLELLYVVFSQCRLRTAHTHHLYNLQCTSSMFTLVLFPDSPVLHTKEGLVYKVGILGCAVSAVVGKLRNKT